MRAPSSVHAVTDHDRRIAAMFDRIAPRYDRLNRVLSFGTDRSWRRRAVALARLGAGELALDIGAGTGDLAIGLLIASDESARVVGIDLAAGMLRISEGRLERAGLGRGYAPPLPRARANPPPGAP